MWRSPRCQTRAAWASPSPIACAVRRASASWLIAGQIEPSKIVDRLAAVRGADGAPGVESNVVGNKSHRPIAQRDLNAARMAAAGGDILRIGRRRPGARRIGVPVHAVLFLLHDVGLAG